MITEKDFWEWFVKNEMKYFYLDQLDDEKEKEKLLGVLLSKLHSYCEGLYFEVGGIPNQKKDLIITAAGDELYFAQAEQLVNGANDLNYWNIISLKQPSSDSFTVNFNSIILDIKNIWFIPLSNKTSKKIGLRVYVDRHTVDQRKHMLEAVNIALCTILGEKAISQDIGYVELDTIPSTNEREELIEFLKLPDYISWKKARLI